VFVAEDSSVFGKVVGWATILATVIALAAWLWPTAPSNGNQPNNEISTSATTPTAEPNAGAVTPSVAGVAPSGAGAPQQAPSSQAVEGQVKRQGTTTFGDYVEGDLDSNSPDWDISKRSSGRDFRIYSGQMLMYNPGVIGYFGNHSPSYSECQAFTNYGQPESSRWAPGKSFCIRTGEGRFASLTVKQNDDAPQWSLTASVVVWKSQEDAP
jgi:hypothetical protein